MKEGVQVKKKWVLTLESLETLLRTLDPDRDVAGARYEQIRASLLKLFESRGCAAPAELADETIDRVARRLSEGATIYTPNTYLYFHGVALRVLQEYRRSQSPPQLPPPQPDDAAETERRFECMHHCLQQLSADNLQLLAEYCEGDAEFRNHNRKAMAARMGISLNTLRLRVHRLRDQLAKCVSNCRDSGSRKDW